MPLQGATPARAPSTARGNPPTPAGTIWTHKAANFAPQGMPGPARPAGRWGDWWGGLGAPNYAYLSHITPQYRPHPQIPMAPTCCWATAGPGGALVLQGLHGPCYLPHWWVLWATRGRVAGFGAPQSSPTAQAGWAPMRWGGSRGGPYRCCKDLGALGWVWCGGSGGRGGGQRAGCSLQCGASAWGG